MVQAELDRPATAFADQPDSTGAASGAEPERDAER